MDWRPGVTVGVPGGIPHRTRVFATIQPTDDGAGIQRALDACPDDQVVQLLAGAYRLQRPLRTQNGRTTLRGAGMGKTVLTIAKGEGKPPLSVGSADWPRPTLGEPVLTGADIGSTRLTLVRTDPFTVGGLARLDPVNPPWVRNLNARGEKPSMTFLFRVVAKTPTTVTITPPVPMALQGYKPTLVPYALPPVEGFGVEDLTIDLAGGDAFAAVSMEQAWGCWVKNVEVKGAAHRQMFFYVFGAGEVRGCYVHDAAGGGPNHEGIDFYGDACWNLIEDNCIVDGGFPGIILGDSEGGCQGNAIAYNVGFGVDTGSPETGGADFSFSHGPHNALNLAEGNGFSMVQADGYFGSSSHNTLFRNWLTAKHPTATEGIRAIDLAHFNTHYRVVGNILGSPDFPAAPKGRYAIEAPDYDNALRLIYRLGYPNMGNTHFKGELPATASPDYRRLPPTLPANQQRDLSVERTLLRHGNYDYATRTLQWASGQPRTLPASLLYDRKPAWFGDCPWPPFDPAHPEKAALENLPAGQRYAAWLRRR